MAAQPPRNLLKHIGDGNRIDRAELSSAAHEEGGSREAQG
jgi:hypothetical protein